MLNFLPEKLNRELRKMNEERLYELRIRAGRAVSVNYNGKYMRLPVTLSKEDISDVILRAGEFSVYSVSEEMKELYVTANSGQRIGIAGTVVYDKDKPIGVRNVTSLCIRIPHEIDDCGEKIFEVCERDGLKNCIILSPPGLGKTTVLRNLSKRISKRYPQVNLLIADERGEISAFDCGENADVVKFGKKKEIFSYAIRALRPDVIVTDELQESDFEVVKNAIQAGIVVLASAHYGQAVADFPHPIFQRYVRLGSTIGQIEGVYDENLKPLEG